MNNKKTKRRQIIGYRLICCICFFVAITTAYFFRSYDFYRESLQIGNFVPFTLESAMMYSDSREIAETGTLPQLDKSLVAEKTLSIYKQMSISMELFLGYGYRIKNLLLGKTTHITRNIYGDNQDFCNWARFQIRLWISLSAGIIFASLLCLECSWLLSFFGAILFAVSPAAIARATGQDLIRENFAITIILLFYLFYFLYLKAPKIYKLILVFIFSFISLAAWDMSQLNLVLLGVYEFIYTCSKNKTNSKRKRLWITIFISAIVSGLTIPYLWAHSLIFSPLVDIIIPSILILSFLEFPKVKKTLLGILFLGIFFVAWHFYFSQLGYAQDYSHFFNLIKAKILFLNVKPWNPLLLDFDSRILWTPALHSASLYIIWMLFHLTIYFFFFLMPFCLILKTTRNNLINQKGYEKVLCLFLTIVYFALFILMVRFHALTIPFLCMSVAILADGLQKSSKIKFVFPILIGILILSEGEWFFGLTRNYYSNEKAQIKLIKWINTGSLKNKTILADFTLSPILKAYCHANIVLLPKFENKLSRKLNEKYLNILYHKNEIALNKFCNKYAVNYFLFDKGLAAGGEKTTFMHPWSSRYIAAAFILEKKSPVYRCYYEPDNLSLFYRLDEIPPSQVALHYTIFKVISPQDQIDAIKFFSLAKAALNNNDHNAAINYIKIAVQKNPNSEIARFFYYQLLNKWPYLTLNGLK